MQTATSLDKTQYSLIRERMIQEVKRTFVELRLQYLELIFKK